MWDEALKGDFNHYFSIFDEHEDYCGCIELQNCRSKTPEIGLTLSESKRNQGIAAKVVKLLVQKACSEQEIEYFEVKIKAENSHSRHVFEKMGAVKIGEEEYALTKLRGLLNYKELELVRKALDFAKTESAYTELTKEILSEIRKLKLSISRLKRTMEHPVYYKRNIIIDPSEDVRIHWSREYLKKAKEALADVGGTYKPSRAELRAETFDKMIDSISKVELSIGAFTGGYYTITCTFDGDCVFIFTEHTPHLLLPKTEQKPAQKLNRSEFLFEIGQLHIGEWHTYYDISRFGYMVLDGKQWDLEIVYSDGHKPVKIAGCNSYPYNFWELISLLKADDIFAEE